MSYRIERWKGVGEGPVGYNRWRGPCAGGQSVVEGPWGGEHDSPVVVGKLFDFGPGETLVQRRGAGKRDGEEERKQAERGREEHLDQQDVAFDVTIMEMKIRLLLKGFWDEDSDMKLDWS